MAFWKKTNDITIEIKGYGSKTITYDDIDAFCEIHNILEKDRNYNDIAKFLAIEIIISEKKEEKLKIENDINVLQHAKDSIHIGNTSKKSKTGEWVDPYIYKSSKFEKLKEKEFDSFVNSFLDKDFVERMVEEDKAKKYTNAANPDKETDRMRKNAEFWNYQYSGTPSWAKILEFDNIDNIDSITENDIKERFRKLALIYHPDHGGDVEKFKELLTAKESALLYVGG